MSDGSTGPLQARLLSEMIEMLMWIHGLMSADPLEANRIVQDARHHVTTLVKCSPQDFDRVMLSQADPVPRNQKDWEILAAGLEFLRRERAKRGTRFSV